MRIAIAVFMMLLFPAIAQAQHADNNNAVCRTLVKHKPADNVVYQPGVDVQGKAVVPADVSEAKFKTPDVVKVPLTVDFAKRVAGLTGKDVVMESNIGMLDIHMDGRVMYGDQDWTEETMTLCGQSYVLKAKAEEDADAIPEQSEVAEPEKSEITEPQPKISSKEEPKMPMAKEVPPTEAKEPKETIKIITDRPDLIQGGEYRVEGPQ